MSLPILARHPVPHPTESLMGYVLRLSEVNGYMTPWSVYQFARMKQSDARSTGMKISNLAIITQRHEADLQKIAFAPAKGRSRWCRLLGHDLIPTDLNVTGAKFCPSCAIDKGFIEAHWHLTLMVGCPLHRRLLASCCLKCKRKIRWFRPGILECECGSDLRNDKTLTISPGEACLLDIVRQKALRLPTATENQLSLPQAELLSMNLRAIMVVIRVFGKYQLITDGFVGRPDELQLVSAASRVFEDWPKNFFRLLHSLGDQTTVDINLGVRKQFECIYHALFKNKTIQPPEQAAFLRRAFVDFAMDHWGKGAVDSRLLRGLRGAATGRFITQAAFARQIGVQPRTAAKLLRDRKIPSKRVDCQAASRILVDVRDISIPCSAPGTILRCREAARQLEMSPEVLQSLRRHGIFRVQHLSPTRPGFHTLDVQVFKQRLLGLGKSSGQSIDKEAGISLGAILRTPHVSAETKAEAVGAILMKEIAVLSNIDGTIRGLTLQINAYQHFLKTVRSAMTRGDGKPQHIEQPQTNRPEVVDGMTSTVLRRLTISRGSEVAEASPKAFKEAEVEA